MVRIFLIIFTTLKATAGYSQSDVSEKKQDETVSMLEETQPAALPPPKLDDWYKRWQQDNKSSGGKINPKILIIKMSEKKFEPINVGDAANRDSAVLYSPSDAELALVVGINQTASGNSCTQKRPQLLRCFSAGFILDTTRSNWELLSAGKSEEKLSRLVRAPKDPDDDYLNWIRKSLGFDGRVLESKDGYVLAVTAKLPAFGKITGHLLLESENKIFLKQNEIKLGAKLELVEAKGRLAVFKIISENGRDVLAAPQSTKISLDQISDQVNKESEHSENAVQE